jgi:hypothetical protein
LGVNHFSIVTKITASQRKEFFISFWTRNIDFEEKQVKEMMADLQKKPVIPE